MSANALTNLGILIALLFLGWLAWEEGFLPIKQAVDTPATTKSDDGGAAQTGLSSSSGQSRTTINLSTNGQETHTATITLSPVGGRIGSGSANRTYVAGQFTHTVTASLPTPAVGRFYEGWLTDGTRVLSTGQLSGADDGSYQLTYESPDDLRSLVRVVITEETSANGLDSVPEDHVLEGSFQEER